MVLRGGVRERGHDVGGRCMAMLLMGVERLPHVLL